MDNNTLQIEIKQRLNKLDSKNYDNLEPWVIANAVNRAQLMFVKSRLKQPEIDGATIEDLQPLLKTVPLSGTNFTNFYETGGVPSDYLRRSRLYANIIEEGCDPKLLRIYFLENSNTSFYQNDKLLGPSKVWAETFATMQENKFIIYTNNLFTIDTPKLTYYRYPQKVEINGSINIETGLNYTADQICEFTDDAVYEIIDIAITTIAGSIESFNQYTIHKK
jgi:hypothetical protein